jgi:hypothetical protein
MTTSLIVIGAPDARLKASAAPLDGLRPNPTGSSDGRRAYRNNSPPGA